MKPRDYSIVYTCPGSQDRRTESFKGCDVRVEHGCIIVSEVEVGTTGYYILAGTIMILPPGYWFSVRMLPEGLLESLNPRIGASTKS